MFPIFIIKGLWFGFCLYISISYLIQSIFSTTENFINMHISGMKDKDYRFTFTFASTLIKLCLAWTAFYFLTLAPNFCAIPKFLGNIRIW